MKLTKIALVLAVLALAGCNNANQEKADTVNTNEIISEASPAGNDSVVFSFVFTGCNRVDHGDSSNASTANVLALQSIFRDITALAIKPSLLFLLGDVVLGESDTKHLDRQLKAWVNQYNDAGFSNIVSSGIEMVAVPGNHEMLNRQEKPLKGSTDVWLKYMANYMPPDRRQIASTPGLDNRMTFSFTRNHIGFIVMNTDSYNPPTASNPQGLEGQVPTDSIIAMINNFKADKTIKHIFVLGHKPYYVNGKSCTGHPGLPEGPILWPIFNKLGVVAMLSAHEHDYQRWQLPADTGTYQIIAGNAGSPGEAKFYGYSVINILSSGKVQLLSRGFTKQDSYWRIPNPLVFTSRDSTFLTWGKNSNPYPNHTSDKDCDLKN